MKKKLVKSKKQKILVLATTIPLTIALIAVLVFLVIIPAFGRYLISHVDTKYETIRSMMDMLPQAIDVPMASIEEIEIPGSETSIPARVYTPKSVAENPVLILYLHGGGFVLGSPASCDRTCRSLANRVGCCVISLHYRLAPEHPYPAGLTDSTDAFLWLIDNAGDYNSKKERIVVAGDSAGANLSAVLCLIGREQNLPGPAGQILISPPVGSINPETGELFESYRECSHDKVLTVKSVEHFATMYLGDPQARMDDTHVNPLYAKSHKGLAPAMITTCETDPLRDEGLAYVETLREAGVPVMHKHFTDKHHAWSGSEVIDMAVEFISSL